MFAFLGFGFLGFVLWQAAVIDPDSGEVGAKDEATAIDPVSGEVGAKVKAAVGDGKGDLARLQGTWLGESRWFEVRYSVRFTIEGKNFTEVQRQVSSGAETTHHGQIELDEATDPKQMTLSVTSVSGSQLRVPGRIPREVLAIYKLDERGLTRRSGRSERPTKFDDKDQAQILFARHERRAGGQEASADEKPAKEKELTDLEKKFVGRWVGARRGAVLTLVITADRTFRETIANETTENRETTETSEGTWAVEEGELPPTLVRRYTRSNYERLDGIVTKTKVVGLDDSSISFPNADNPLLNITYHRSKREPPTDGERPAADEKKPERAKELVELEKKLVGTWAGYADRTGEGYTFRADGTFTQRSAPFGHHVEEGTWTFDWNTLPSTLVLKITTSNNKETLVGTVLKHKVAGLNETRLSFENPHAEPLLPGEEPRPITYIRRNETPPGNKPAPKRGKGQPPLGEPRRADVQGTWSCDDNGLAQVFFTLDLKDDGSFVLTQRDTAVKFEDQTLGVWEMGVDVTRPNVVLRRKRWLKDGKEVEGREGFDILSLTRGDGEWLMHHPKHGTYHKHDAVPQKRDIKDDPDVGAEKTVRPTFELAEIIREYERSEAPPIEGLTESAERWRAFRNEGKTMWGSEKWMKTPEDYQKMPTSELAADCLSRSVFATTILKYKEPQFGIQTLTIMHDGFAELFDRDDLWTGIHYAYGDLGSQLTPDADLATVVRVSLTFDALTALYRDPTFKKQVKGREAQFLEANLQVLERYRALLDAFENGKVDRNAIGFFREPVSVAQVALMLVKQVDPKRYTAVEPTLTGISFSSRQDVGELKHFLEAVITAIESVIQTEQTTPSEAP